MKNFIFESECHQCKRTWLVGRDVFTEHGFMFCSPKCVNLFNEDYGDATLEVIIWKNVDQRCPNQGSLECLDETCEKSEQECLMASGAFGKIFCSRDFAIHLSRTIEHPVWYKTSNSYKPI
jgi:hypothetical protein